MRSTTGNHDIRLSACLIVKDEEARLPECLASIAFCDEVIVVDSGSTDRTTEIARASGATILEHPWEGFAVQRNVGLDAARGEWILEIDADERVTPRLRDEIIALVADRSIEVDNAAVPVREVLFGVPLGPSALYRGVARGYSGVTVTDTTIVERCTRESGPQGPVHIPVGISCISWRRHWVKACATCAPTPRSRPRSCPT